jgi:guanylate kinase
VSRLSSRAFPVVLAAPSGTGKTTIAHALVNGGGRFVFSVSATTRPPRGGEESGKAYDFLDEGTFRRMIDAGEFVEWATVHGHLYGTPRRNLEAAAARGEYPVLDIDVQGAEQIRAMVPDAVLIFVFPPSAAALVERLRGRATETSPEVRRRLRAAHGELERAVAFDYLVVNDELERAVAEVHRIVEVEAYRSSRVGDFPAEVARLRREIDAVLAAEGAVT